MQQLLKLEQALSEKGKIFLVEVMIKEKHTAAVKIRSGGEACVGFLSKSGDQVHRHTEVVKRYDASHRGPITPERSTQDVHAMDGVGSEPCPSWEVGLRNDVKPFDICQIQRTCCWDLPDGMKDDANLSYKKTSTVCQQSRGRL